MKMNNPLSIAGRLAVIPAILAAFGSATWAGTYTEYVDPFIGTSGKGHTFPGAAYPLGLVQLSPDSGNGSWDYIAGYQYLDPTVDGFSHTHLSGGGGAEMGDVLIFPFSSELMGHLQKAGYRKSNESASPGYYTTELTEDDIIVELSATRRTGIHRYTFPENADKHILVSIDRILWSWGTAKRGLTYDAEIRIKDDGTILGQYESRAKLDRPVNFAIRFDQPITGSRFIDSPRNKKLVLTFASDVGREVIARVGISTVSPEGALLNLEKESVGKSFNAIRDAASDAWEGYLSRIEIKGTEEEKVKFYTSMYHLFIQPNVMPDANGRYRGGDIKVHTSEKEEHYSTLALWDTYRGAHPLYTIIVPDKNAAFMKSLLRHYEEAGHLPVWGFWGSDSTSMIGHHAVTVLWDAIQKGIGDIDEELAFEAMKATLTKNHWRKYDWSKYDPYGYFPSDIVSTEPVSRALEACLDDWCAAQLAKRLGKMDDYEFFMNRSQFYRNLFDSETGFFRGKLSDGSWEEPFDPMEYFHAGSSNGPFTEGNAWQYLWSVQHDIEGLIELLGGPAALGARLDTLFSLPEVVYSKGKTNDISGLMGQYAHGNEPSHHVAYLYNYAGRPYRTQEVMHEIFATMYHTGPDGLVGNDDFGQMSAWYILSSLGFYPVHPASGIYDLGIPQHAYAKIHLGGTDKSLVVRAKSNGEDDRYVRRITFNGKVITDYKISYAEIMSGGELVFELGDKPLPFSLFDGSSLVDWDGNPDIWSVEDGAITGQTREPHLLEENQFLIWKGAPMRNFKLTLKARQTGNNSGIQYRNKLHPELGPWSVAGYQCDIHPVAVNNGMLYDQYGRETLAQNGQTVIADENGELWTMDTHEPVDVDVEDWQEYMIIADGPSLTHYINGELTTRFVDLDKQAREEDGRIAIQIHKGPAMKIQVKDITLQELPAEESHDTTHVQ